jgi:membrane fusion protein (multidrug efflux system)
MLLKRLVIVLLLLALLFGGVFWFKQRQFQQMAAMFSAPRPPAVVTATEVTGQPWRPQLSAVGSVVAVQGIEVANEVPGLVREIAFDSGQHVARGDVLVRLDDAVDQAQLRGLQAALGLAKVRFQRAARLIKQRSVSKSDYDAAEAELSNARAQVASQQALIQKKVIRAPFDGVLGLRAVSVGQYLPTGTAIVPLQTLDTVFVDFSVPERQLGEVAPGQTVRVTVDARPDLSHAGEVVAINPGVDAVNRMLRLRARLANPDGLLRPGMFAKVTLDLGRSVTVLTLPQVAISYAPYGDAVFVVSEQDGKSVVQQRQVHTGAVIGERVVIAQGLEAGEQVVLTGQVKLRNGMPVQIDNKVVPATEAASQ